MKPVGYLDKHYADVVTDSQQQLAEVLGLLACLIAEHTTADLCQTVYNLRNLVAEQTRYVFYTVIRVFYHIVQQGRTYTGTAKTDLAHADTRDSKRVHYIRFAAQATHSVMRLVGKIERMRNQLRLLTMGSARIIV